MQCWFRKSVLAFQDAFHYRKLVMMSQSHGGGTIPRFDLPEYAENRNYTHEMILVKLKQAANRWYEK